VDIRFEKADGVVLGGRSPVLSIKKSSTFGRDKTEK